jgi:hypothetical protein
MFSRTSRAYLVAEPHQEGGERQVPGQLVEEGRLEGGEALIAHGPVGGRDLQDPGQVGRPAEELLVEVVADPPNRLADEQRRSGGVHEGGRGDAGTAQAPEADETAKRDAAPDPHPAVPDRERSQPVGGHFARAGRVKVEAPADHSGRKPHIATS